MNSDLSTYGGPQCLAGPHCTGCGLPGCPIDEQKKASDFERSCQNKIQHATPELAERAARDLRRNRRRGGATHRGLPMPLRPSLARRQFIHQEVPQGAPARRGGKDRAMKRLFEITVSVAMLALFVAILLHLPNNMN